jgi:4'-phosphopantetheinyl transferase
MKRTTGSPDAWLRPAGVPTLTDADVHVWRAWLGLDSPHLATMRPLLSPDELTRADRLHFDRDRSRFISARAILRILLGSYLSTEPGQLRFRYSLHGKPALADANERRTLCFNLSHLHELALYAVAIKRPLGIDVERVRPDLPYEQMARHVLSRREDAALHALPAELRPKRSSGSGPVRRPT